MRLNAFPAITGASVFLHTLLFLGLFLWPTDSEAQVLSPQPDLRYAITDGEVRSLADGGDIVYLGGTFGYVGPYTGGWATLDATTGTPSDRWPLVRGKVTAMAADGEGGWFIGGEFLQVGDYPCTHLAHLRPDGSVDADWQVAIQQAPGDPVFINALVLSGGSVFFAGDFKWVNGEARRDMAAVDVKTGSLRNWNPDPSGHSSGGIATLAAYDGKIYIGGDFTAVGGATRGGLAGLDAETGIASALNLPVNGWVNVIVASGPTLYFGGNFSSVGNQLRNAAAAVDTVTGGLLPWHPPAASAHDLAVVGERVFIAGDFEGALMAVDPIFGLLTPDQPSLDGVGSALASVDNSLVVGGYFRGLGGEPLSYLAMLDPGTSAVLDWHPNAGGIPVALEAFGNEIGVGGVSSFGGERRNHLAAVDKRTGKVTNWAPQLGPLSAEVLCLAVADDKIIAGGSFTEANGQAITNLVMFDRLGQATALVTPSARVLALAVKEDTLYLGGRFTRCNGLTRRGLAALSLATGELLEWNPGSSGRVNALVPGADGLFVGGNFTNIAGLSRNYLAKLDFATGQATGWNAALLTTANNEINALAIAGDRLHAGGVFSVRIGGTTYRSLASFTTAAAAEGFFPPPSTSPLQTLNSLAAVDDTVWMGGYSGNGLESSSLRQASRLTHQLTGWNPRSDQTVYAQLWDGENLFVGGDFTLVAGESLRGFAVFRRLEEAITIAKSSLKILASTGVSFEVLAGIGHKFAVESSQDFNQWEELETQTATTSRTTITDPRPLGAACYYRVSAR